MRNIPYLFLITFIFCFSVFGQYENTKPPTIEVSGSAEIFVQPDEVSLSIDVTKTNKDLQIAKNEADTSLSQIFAITRKFNIKTENVKTHYISVAMKYNSLRDLQHRVFDEDGDEIGTKVFVGYEVSTTVSVMITDVSCFQDFLDEVLKTGLTEVSNVKFESSELRKYKDQAREMAMKAAFEKATAMAVSINQKIGKAISIKEGKLSDQTFNNYNGNVYANSTTPVKRDVVPTKESVATFSPGAISISREVSVIFLLD